MLDDWAERGVREAHSVYESTCQVVVPAEAGVQQRAVDDSAGAGASAQL